MRAINASELVSRIIENGGITVNLDNGSSPCTGFAVSIPGHEERFRWVLTAENVRDYIKRNAAALTTPGAHLGAWWNDADDSWYLDTSVVCPDEKLTLRLGAQWNQQAIYDLQRGQSILVPQWMHHTTAEQGGIYV